jgi:hypothetical protein
LDKIKVRVTLNPKPTSLEKSSLPNIQTSSSIGQIKPFDECLVRENVLWKFKKCQAKIYNKCARSWVSYTIFIQSKMFGYIIFKKVFNV